MPRRRCCRACPDCPTCVLISDTFEGTLEDYTQVAGDWTISLRPPAVIDKLLKTTDDDAIIIHDTPAPNPAWRVDARISIYLENSQGQTTYKVFAGWQDASNHVYLRLKCRHTGWPYGGFYLDYEAHWVHAGVDTTLGTWSSACVQSTALNNPTIPRIAICFDGCYTLTFVTDTFKTFHLGADYYYYDCVELGRQFGVGTGDVSIPTAWPVTGDATAWFSGLTLSDFDDLCPCGCAVCAPGSLPAEIEISFSGVAYDPYYFQCTHPEQWNDAVVVLVPYTVANFGDDVPGWHTGNCADDLCRYAGFLEIVDGPCSHVYIVVVSFSLGLGSPDACGERRVISANVGINELLPSNRVGKPALYGSARIPSVCGVAICGEAVNDLSMAIRKTDIFGDLDPGYDWDNALVSLTVAS